MQWQRRGCSFIQARLLLLMPLLPSSGENGNESRRRGRESDAAPDERETHDNNQNTQTHSHLHHHLPFSVSH